METVTLDDFTAFNSQLSALVAAGVPIDIGLSQSQLPAAIELEHINATVARRVSRGESLDEALEGDERDVPATYRSLVKVGLYAGNLSAALEGSNRVAESVEDSRNAFEIAALYPLVLCALAYLGLIGFSLYLVPVLQNMLSTLGITSGPGLRVLSALRETLPYWVGIPPFVLLILIGGWMRSKSRPVSTAAPWSNLLRWLPGVAHIIFLERCDRFASSLASLLKHNARLADALLIAGDASGDAELTRAAKSLADAEQAGSTLSDDSPAAQHFPPFLRWAIWHSEATTGRVRALEFAAQLYHDAAERRAQRLRAMAPMAVLVLVGGSVTLLYGLSLFVPLVELLRAIARA